MPRAAPRRVRGHFRCPGRAARASAGSSRPEHQEILIRQEIVLFGEREAGGLRVGKEVVARDLVSDRRADRELPRGGGGAGGPPPPPQRPGGPVPGRGGGPGGRGS